MNYDKNTAKLIWDFFKGKGLNDFACAGILGNLYAESGLRSNNLQNSAETRLGLSDDNYTLAVDSGAYRLFATDRAGYGLAQWTSEGRKAGLINYVIGLHCSISDINAQLIYLWLELNGSYKKKVLDVLLTATSVRESAEVFVVKFEVPKSVIDGGQSKENTINTRAEYAQEFYDLFKGVSKLKIAIDAGHGLNTSGKRCMKAIDANETREWFLNDRIADKLQVLLEGYNCQVLRTDDTTGITDVSLSNRVKKANEWGADVFISIHHNAGIKGGNGGGTVVYYYNKYTTQTQAKALYDAVVTQTNLRGNRSTPVNKGNFQVIRETKMTALLIENGFMDSKADTPVILTEAHADKTAKGLLNFLIRAYGIKAVEPVTDSVLYRVQCGAFRNKANAEALQNKLASAGFEAYITVSK